MPKPKDRLKQKGLQAYARFGLRYLFTEIELDPHHAPELAAYFEEFRQIWIAYAESGELEKEFYSTAGRIREAFIEKNPRLRVRYAHAINVEANPTEH